MDFGKQSLPVPTRSTRDRRGRAPLQKAVMSRLHPVFSPGRMAARQVGPSWSAARRGTAWNLHTATGFRALLNLTADASIVGLDVPIGLLDRPVPRGRSVDQIARALLKQRASTVFSPPPRWMFGAKGHGVQERARLFADKTTYQDIARYLGRERPRGVKEDDVLAAFVACWTAGRIARGEAICLPSLPDRDSRIY